MKRLTAIGLTILLLAKATTAAGVREMTAPLAPPYAADRAVLKSDFVRLDWTDAARRREVPAKVYFPADANTPGPFPVLIFSHGLGGTREAYEYLARQWAANGYVSVHLQHRGSDDSAWRGQPQPMQSMRKAASYANSVDRARDVTFALDRLESLNTTDATLKGKLDLSKVGVAGHSFGAQTTLLVAGQRMGPARAGAAGGAAGDFTDPRVKAAIPMSAPIPALRTDLDAVYADVKIPTFHMTGTRDDSPIGDTRAIDRRIPFDHIKTNTYLLTFKDGDHMVFSGRLAPRPNDLEFQRLILLASTAFWDANLKADAAAKKWLDDDSADGLKAAIGESGTFERK